MHVGTYSHIYIHPKKWSLHAHISAYKFIHTYTRTHAHNLDVYTDATLGVCVWMQHFACTHSGMTHHAWYVAY